MRVEMNKVYILSHSDYEKDLLRELQKLGCLQISNVKEEVEGEEVAQAFSRKSEFASSYDPRLSQLNSMIKFLQSFQEKKADPLELFVTLKHSVQLPEKEWENHARDGLQNLDSVSAQCRGLEKRLDKIHTRRMKLEELKANLEKIIEFRVSLDEVADTWKTRAVIGRFKPADYQEFRKRSPSTHVSELSVGPTSVSAMLIYFKDDNIIEKALSETNFAPVQIPDLGEFRGTPGQIKEGIEQELAGFVKEENEIAEKARGIYEKWRLPLLSAHDHLSLVYQQKEQAKQAVSSQKTFLIRAWCKKESAAKVKEAAERVAKGNAEVMIREPSEKDNPPVLLENKGMMGPFEIITRTFTLPSYNNLDPTPYLAPFFFIFTGICLTDAVYGVALAAISFFMARRYAQLRNFFTLLMYIGISTAIIGALIGSWAGGLIPVQPILFDSLKEPITFLLFAFILGYIHLMFGIFLKMYENFTKKQYIDALCDQGLWVGMLIAIPAFALGSMGFLPPFAEIAGQYAALLFALGLILTQGRREKSIIKRLGYGVISLYGLMNYLADTLSYSRLLALGMATGVIGLIVNQIAGMTMAIPFIGIFIAIAVLVGGHAFNLAISLMSAYIHSSRLQYVEFFSKFFEGGGKKFVPFREERDYTEKI